MRAALLAAAATFAMAACTGGSGPLPGAIVTQDKAPSSQDPVAKTGEGSASTEEPVARTNESAPPSGDAPSSVSSSTFSCHGTYSCTGTNGDSGSDIVLNGSRASCTTSDGKGNVTSIGADGTISVNGHTYATWSGDDTDFTFTTTDTNTDFLPDGGSTTRTTTDVVTCVKTSDSTAPISDSH